ncbi:MAG: hypothetical protein KHZ85_00500 [Amedibacillus dolichus]|uniref:Uncharacterized protein n=1 Tax=Amedibacillus dolichus TaxID=31971 RepID=A0A943A242_9FIRM|nr:hypothetical protein [Amedibacillus dolichus]MBS4883240.1 hypothetical protein [Amedibacillus dolichus]
MKKVNKMKNDFGSISRLSEKCRKCPYVKTCNHKEMEALAYLMPATDSILQPVIQPMMKKKDLRNIKIDENTTVTIDLEGLKEQMKKDFYRKVGIGVMNNAS